MYSWVGVRECVNKIFVTSGITKPTAAAALVSTIFYYFLPLLSGTPERTTDGFVRFGLDETSLI